MAFREVEDDLWKKMLYSHFFKPSEAVQQLPNNCLCPYKKQIFLSTPSTL